MLRRWRQSGALGSGSGAAGSGLGADGSGFGTTWERTERGWRVLGAAGSGFEIALGRIEGCVRPN